MHIEPKRSSAYKSLVFPNYLMRSNQVIFASDHLCKIVKLFRVAYELFHDCESVMHLKRVCDSHVLQEFLLCQSLFFSKLVGQCVAQLHRWFEPTSVLLLGSSLLRLVILNHLELPVIYSSDSLELQLHALQLFYDSCINRRKAQYSIFNLQRLKPLFDQRYALTGCLLLMNQT